jgi:hypothetical protein
LGLGPRVPGPTDCENFGLAIEGVSGLKLGFSMVERLKLWLNEGVIGEGGKSDESAEARFCARWQGRKMPEPGIDVWKYCVLHNNQYRRIMCDVGVCIPVNSAVIFAPRCKLSAQFDSSEDALLAMDASHELDDALHVSGNIHPVANNNVSPICAHPRRW